MTAPLLMTADAYVAKFGHHAPTGMRWCCVLGPHQGFGLTPEDATAAMLCGKLLERHRWN